MILGMNDITQLSAVSEMHDDFTTHTYRLTPTLNVTVCDTQFDRSHMCAQDEEAHFPSTAPTMKNPQMILPALDGSKDSDWLDTVIKYI